MKWGLEEHTAPNLPTVVFPVLSIGGGPLGHVTSPNPSVFILGCVIPLWGDTLVILMLLTNRT